MARTIVVSNAAELLKAITSATGGENIVLKGGDYGNLALNSATNLPVHYSSQVTISSADGSNPAVFTGLKLTGVDNLKFDDVKFDYRAAVSASTTISPFQLNNCKNVTITNSDFDGDKGRGLGVAQDGYGVGNGLSVSGCTNTTISNNDFHDFHRGLVFSKSNGVTVSGNDLHGMSSDGMDFAQVSNVVIDGNHIHDFLRSPTSLAHPDMIQFWTAGTKAPSTNIQISNNLLDMGSGIATQSIFMRNELVDTGKAGKEMFYQNVVISNNVIKNGHLHGITVGETNNLTIDNNTLLQAVSTEVGGSVSVPTIHISKTSTAVTVTDNVVPRLDQTLVSHVGWKFGNNYIAQADDANAANYVGKLYYDALDKTNATINDFRAVQGSEIDKLHVGSTLTNTTLPSGYIDNHQTSGSNMLSQKQTFDVTHIYDSLGKSVAAGATVKWDFGDGTKGTGLITNHAYATQGDFTATATIILASGKTLVIDKTIHVESSNILDVNFNSSAADYSATVNAVTLGTAKMVATANGGHAVDLNGGTVKYHTNNDFFNNSEYTLSVDFKKDVGQENTGGRLVYFSGAFVVSLGADGLNVAVSSSLGTTTLKADKLGIADTDWHRVGLTFSGTTGLIKLYLDGHEVASASGLKGAVEKGSTNADFYLGNPFGAGFGGQVDNLHFTNIALDNTAMTTGSVAVVHSDINNLAMFDTGPAAVFAAAQTASPTAGSTLAAIDTHVPQVSLPLGAHHYDFNIL
jgi:parallel beta-helix repeat protein